VKRVLDIVAAVLGLVVLAPLLAIIALAVRLDSSGPVLFRQTRVGRNGRPFEILKFRSMHQASSPAVGAPLLTTSTDPRITRIGAVLRRTKLDELPQLLNVMVGDMSLVGPRPEVPRYVAAYSDEARSEILSVRPGITDEAAIEFRDESALLELSSDPERTYVEEILPRKVEHYRRYVRNRTLLGDLSILARTIWRVIRPSDLRRE
jgi:lipopolysaccharide/colanic/teichoic acid biosynthesis glycosyltransferase